MENEQFEKEKYFYSYEKIFNYKALKKLRKIKCDLICQKCKIKKECEGTQDEKI